MEPYAAKTVLLPLVETGLNIASFTTDRSSSIRTMMETAQSLVPLNMSLIPGIGSVSIKHRNQIKPLLPNSVHLEIIS